MLIEALQPVADTVTVLAANPFDNATPDFGALGNAFQSKTTVLLSVVWGLFMFAAAFFLMRGISSLGAAKTAQNPGAIDGAKTQVTWSLVCLIGLALAGVIYGAVLVLAS